MRRFARALLLVLQAVGGLSVSSAWQKAEAYWPWDDDILFGEWLLPCQYRSPPVSGCRKYRHCKRIGNRWLCSRWMERPARKKVAKKGAARKSGVGKNVRRKNWASRHRHR